MSTDLNEKLSALMDGELDPAEHHEVLDQLLADSALQTQWSGYHLAREFLAEAAPPLAVGDLSQRITRALADEPAHHRPRHVLTDIADARHTRSTSNTRGAWLRPLGGLALAASVATIAILGLRAINQLNPAATDVVASIVNAPVQNVSLRWNVQQPGVEARLNGYLVNHSAYLGRGVRGMLPYARIVAYDNYGQ